MPKDGIIKDPANNPSVENRFGILQDFSDGHLKLYLKDDENENESRFFPAYTPVRFETVSATITIKDKDPKNGTKEIEKKYTVEVAKEVKIRSNTGNIDQELPMIDQYIKLAKVKLRKKEKKYDEWTDKDKIEIKKPDQIGLI